MPAGKWQWVTLCVACLGVGQTEAADNETASAGRPISASVLRIARSDDGLHFADTGEVFLQRAAAPDLTSLPNGHVLAIFDYEPEARDRDSGGLACSVSRDGGRSWTLVRPIRFQGTGGQTVRGRHGDLVRSPDGRWRLYFAVQQLPNTAGVSDESRATTQILSAVSETGWTYRIDHFARIGADGKGDLHPMAIGQQSHVHLYIADGGISPYRNGSAAQHRVSRDGRRFAGIAPTAIPNVQFVGSLVPTGQRVRAYVSSNRGIRSLVSENGRDWTMDPGVRVAKAWDPGVTQLKDGSYLMLYCAALDEQAAQQPQLALGSSRSCQAGHTARSGRDGEAITAGDHDTSAPMNAESADRSALAGAADGAANDLWAGEPEPSGPIADLLGGWMDLCGDLTEPAFPPAPDFKSKVDYGQWFEKTLVPQTADNAFDAYASFVPTPWAAQGSVPELPELKNLFTDLKRDCPPGPWDPAEHPDWEASNQQVQELLARFRDASMHEGYAPPYLQPVQGEQQRQHEPLLIELRLPGLSAHRQLAKATLADAWRLEDGRVSSERMLDAWETVSRGATHVGQGATLIEQLVSNAERALVQQNARRALEQNVFSEQELETALDVLMEYDRDTSYPGLGPRGEHAMCMDLTQFLFFPEDGSGEPALNRDRLDYLTESVLGEMLSQDTIDAMSAMSPDDIRATVDAFDSHYREVAAQMRIGYPDVRAADIDATHERYRHTNAVTELLTCSIGKAHQIRARAEASRRATQLSYATHLFKARHGRWPESLDELPARHRHPMRTDPFTGRDFGYRVSDDGPTIYSLSENGLDDGGVHSFRWDSEITNDAGSDDYVFWPPQWRD